MALHVRVPSKEDYARARAAAIDFEIFMLVRPPGDYYVHGSLSGGGGVIDMSVLGALVKVSIRNDLSMADIAARMQKSGTSGKAGGLKSC